MKIEPVETRTLARDLGIEDEVRAQMLRILQRLNPLLPPAATRRQRADLQETAAALVARAMVQAAVLQRFKRHGTADEEAAAHRNVGRAIKALYEAGPKPHASTDAFYAALTEEVEALLMSPLRDDGRIAEDTEGE